jgi:translation elongation factor EF-Ts
MEGNVLWLTIMPGRIESYIHSDNSIPNKGGSLIEVSCQSDFGAKAEGFIAFTKKLARLVYAAQHVPGDTWWEKVATAFPRMALEKTMLEKEIGEDVELLDAAVFILEDDDGQE